MVNIKDYNEYEDYLQHKKEFSIFYQNISKYTTLEGLNVLDLGASWGKHMGFLIESNANFVLGADITDYNAYFINESKQKFIDYYNKFNLHIKSNLFDFVRLDAQNMSFKDSSFDVVFCVNSFEHIPNPEKTLIEINRVLKRGGYAFISFIPVFHSDVGSHMIDFVPEPWAHIKYPENEYIELLSKATPGTQYFINEYMHGLNKLPRKYYMNLFNTYSIQHIIKNNLINKLLNKILFIAKRKGYFEVLEKQEWHGVSKTEYLNHENFMYLQKKYPKDDLLFQGMYVLMKKI